MSNRKADYLERIYYSIIIFIIYTMSKIGGHGLSRIRVWVAPYQVSRPPTIFMATKLVLRNHYD